MNQKSKKTDGITVRTGNVSSNYQPGFASNDESIPTIMMLLNNSIV